MPFSQKLRTLRAVLSHPLSNGRRQNAAMNFLAKQIRQRRDTPPESGLIPFRWVNETQLLRGPGVTNGNDQWIYGLTETEQMAFLLHYLRPDDLFVDVGANEGAFTVLASGSCEARTIAVEPVPLTCTVLKENVRRNAIGHRVDVHACACGEASGGELEMRLCARSTLNAVATGESEEDEATVMVPVCALDDLVGDAEVALLKIDVEGFETAVLQGFQNAIEQGRVGAAIIELGGLGQRYGFDEEVIEDWLMHCGLQPCRYDPKNREITGLDDREAHGSSVLFVSNITTARTRVREADAFELEGLRM